jgi:hypothetical protein
MIRLDTRPSEEGRFIYGSQFFQLNFNPRLLREGEREECRQQKQNSQVLSRKIDPSLKDQFIFLKKHVDSFSASAYKKDAPAELTAEAAPNDGLGYQTRPSVVGWKSKVFCKPRQLVIHQKWKTKMTRNPNTTRTGGAFSAATIEAVWRKATPLRGNPGYAKDQCGKIIYRHSYGKISDYGWEIDHIKPVSKGGSDALSNLQPLHWKNNRSKSADYPRYTCALRS